MHSKAATVRSDRATRVPAALLVITLGLYFLGAPTVSVLLNSWWPMVIGAASMLGLVCVILGATLIIGTERTTPASESEEVTDAGELPRPIRQGRDQA